MSVSKSLNKRTVLIFQILESQVFALTAFVLLVVAVFAYLFLRIFTNYDNIAVDVITAVQVLVTFMALALSYSILPYLDSIRQSVVGRESYIQRARAIYSSSTEISGLIEGWDGHKDYHRTLQERNNLENIRFIGPVHPDNTSLLGAIHRYQTIYSCKGCEAFEIRHIERRHINFKFIVGENQVLIGEEYGTGNELHKSDSGIFLESETKSKHYVKHFKNSFEEYWKLGQPLYLRVYDLVLERESTMPKPQDVDASTLLESIVEQRHYVKFFDDFSYIDNQLILQTFIELYQKAYDEKNETTSN